MAAAKELDRSQIVEQSNVIGSKNQFVWVFSRLKNHRLIVQEVF